MSRQSVDDDDEPPAWENFNSTLLNKPFWLNVITLELSWKDPTIEEVNPWIEKFSEKYMRNYWKHSITGETKWTNPIEESKPIIKLDASKTSTLSKTSNNNDDEEDEPPAWEHFHSDLLTKPFWINVITLDISWKDPNIGSEQSPWVEKYSEKYKRSYWKHNISGETRWTDPSLEAPISPRTPSVFHTPKGERPMSVNYTKMSSKSHTSHLTTNDYPDDYSANAASYGVAGTTPRDSPSHASSTNTPRDTPPNFDRIKDSLRGSQSSTFSSMFAKLSMAGGTKPRVSISNQKDAPMGRNDKTSIYSNASSSSGGGGSHVEKTSPRNNTPGITPLMKHPAPPPVRPPSPNKAPPVPPPKFNTVTTTKKPSAPTGVRRVSVNQLGLNPTMLAFLNDTAATEAALTTSPPQSARSHTASLKHPPAPVAPPKECAVRNYGGYTQRGNLDLEERKAPNKGKAYIIVKYSIL